MKLLFVLLLLVLCPVSLSAQTYGVAYFAMSKFSDAQCAQALKVFRGLPEIAVSTLWGSFGYSTKCLDRLIAAHPNKQITIEIHASNETCKRSPRWCTRYDGLKFSKHLKQIAALIRNREAYNVTWIVSTGLEDDYTNAFYKKRLSQARKLLPDYVGVARNPNAENTYFLGADYVELHSLQRRIYKCSINKRPLIYSNDGLDLDFGDGRNLNRRATTAYLFSKLRQKRKDYSYVFIWWNSQGFNEHKFIEPRKRNIRIYSSNINKVNKLLRRFYR